MDVRELILLAMATLVGVLAVWWARVLARATAGTLARWVRGAAEGELHPARALLSADWLAVTLVVPLAAWPLWPVDADQRAVLAPTAGRLAGPDAYEAVRGGEIGRPGTDARDADERVGPAGGRVQALRVRHEARPRVPGRSEVLEVARVTISAPEPTERR